MAESQQLVPPSPNKLSIVSSGLKPQEELLLIELALTAENVGTQVSADLQSEFLREFGDESPELLERVFRSWRRRSKFMPKVSEIYDLLEEEAHARYQEREAKRDRAATVDGEGARKDWNDYCVQNGIPVGTSQTVWIKQQCAQIAEKQPEVAKRNRRAFNLPEHRLCSQAEWDEKKARAKQQVAQLMRQRQEENDAALAQSKALRDLPPRKHPKPLPADAGAPLKQAEKAVRGVRPT